MERRLYVVARAARRYDDVVQMRAVFDWLAPLCPDVRLMHAGSHGDHLVDVEAHARFWTVLERKPVWAKYKANALRQVHYDLIGVLLDRRTLGYDTMVVGFQAHDDPGIKDLLQRARKCELEVKAVHQHGQQTAGQQSLLETEDRLPPSP